MDYSSASLGMDEICSTMFNLICVRLESKAPAKEDAPCCVLHLMAEHARRSTYVDPLFVEDALKCIMIVCESTLSLVLFIIVVVMRACVTV